MNANEDVVLKNAALQVTIPRDFGPRISGIQLRDSGNLLVDLPAFSVRRPDGKEYFFHGGHRLWLAPEDPLRSYASDDQAVEIISSDSRLLVRKQVEAESGIEKSVEISLQENAPRLTIIHSLTNGNAGEVRLAPWAITQLKPGGVAILPQETAETGLLPNRLITLWPYSDIACPQVQWGNRHILVRAEMQSPFKVGFPNRRGWLAYWLEGTLFVKRARYNPGMEYPDLGCTSECYCNPFFLELETLAPMTMLAPGQTASHEETWELHPDMVYPKDDGSVQMLMERAGLE